MTKNYWVISDTHFNHVKSLTWRPQFNSLSHMNEHMIAQWNRVVQPQDHVYHLGDVFFGPKPKFEQIWSRLNGKKRLIVGNHDDIRYLAGGNDNGKFFQKIAMWRQWKIDGVKLLMTHAPLHQSALTETREGSFNVFGHIHENQTPPGPYKCVCVEHVNYTPVNIDTIVKEAKKYV